MKYIITLFLFIALFAVNTIAQNGKPLTLCYKAESVTYGSNTNKESFECNDVISIEIEPDRTCYIVVNSTPLTILILKPTNRDGNVYHMEGKDIMDGSPCKVDLSLLDNYATLYINYLDGSFEYYKMK